jgi:hypothetical protein
MARALVEQRRILALDGDAQASVLTALDALTLAPERFNMESNVSLWQAEFERRGLTFVAGLVARGQNHRHGRAA